MNTNHKESQMIVFRAPTDLAAEARRLAAAEDRSLSNFIKIALRDAVAKAKEGQHAKPALSA